MACVEEVEAPVREDDGAARLPQRLAAAARLLPGDQTRGLIEIESLRTRRAHRYPNANESGVGCQRSGFCRIDSTSLSVVAVAVPTS